MPAVWRLWGKQSRRIAHIHKPYLHVSVTHCLKQEFPTPIRAFTSTVQLDVDRAIHKLPLCTLAHPVAFEVEQTRRLPETTLRNAVSDTPSMLTAFICSEASESHLTVWPASAEP
jgi:hypothetical protein